MAHSHLSSVLIISKACTHIVSCSPVLTVEHHPHFGLEIIVSQLPESKGLFGWVLQQAESHADSVFWRKAWWMDKAVIQAKKDNDLHNPTIIWITELHLGNVCQSSPGALGQLYISVEGVAGKSAEDERLDWNTLHSWVGSLSQTKCLHHVKAYNKYAHSTSDVYYHS